jgi:hypothetical protein
VDWEPLVPLLPDQAPEAAQDSELADFQVNVDVPPLLTVLGAAVSATLGVAVVTVTVVDCEALPPCPVQVNI